VIAPRRSADFSLYNGIVTMLPEETPTRFAAAVNPFTAEGVAGILHQRGWLTAEPSSEQFAWCERAAALLGPQVADSAALADLLGLVFHYDAGEITAQVESHAVLSRYAARDVLRQLALLLLDGTPLTSERFKEIVSALKEGLDLRGRELFHPLRLALAGRSGEGELDRVILLLDEAASLPFAVPVKSSRARILDFCAALD
jgi:glutamyl/glutaminyl-tRNA synthetase